MKLNELVLEIPGFEQFITEIKPETQSLLTGMGSEVTPLVLQTLLDEKQAPVLVVVENEAKVEQLSNQLAGVLGEDKIYTFPIDPMLATQNAFSSPDELAQRISTLNFLLSGKTGVILVTPQALQYQLSQPAKFAAHKLEFEVGQEYQFAELNSWLVQTGYVKEQLVVKPGEFAIRGDIVDIYPLNSAAALRFEFFGDELDSIKEFDIATQKSTNTLTKVAVLPALDRVYDYAKFPAIATTIQQKVAKNQQKLNEEGLGQLLQQLEKTLIALNEQQLPEYRNIWNEYLLEDPASLLDYFSAKGLVIYQDLAAIRKNVKDLDARNADYLAAEIAELNLPKLKNPNFELSKVSRSAKQAKLFFSLFQKGLGRLNLTQIFDLQTRTVQQFFSQIPLIKTELQKYQKQQQTVIIQANNVKRMKQIQQTFIDFGIDAQLKQTSMELSRGEIQIMRGEFTQGFALPQVSLVYLTEQDLFNQKQKRPKRVKNLENAQKIRNYNELKPGDFVVHVNHGIGRFEGISTLEVDGKKRDYITITYQKHDQLFIPADQLGLVQKYTASEGKTPKINKLGGSEWAKTKRSVAAKVEDIADELVELYAVRESQQGFAFSPDNDLVRKFEASFPYPETPDQLRSLAEIKADMEKPKPMDRLLVGDVGFGKTEVAIRAAFKAAQDGKQTAILVPTTILAQQHFETMQERFQDLPVNIGILSRFQTHAQIKQTLADLKSGLIDIVVGTHRVLSKDVEFHDLGLLIVDEEQRFGVKHKERLKELKSQVDVLTLTATPIPRTLHMSMVGVRDLSVIETPPSNRYPIQTYVAEFNRGMVREAILRELERDGQVFYLHNRVDDIENVVFELEQLVPEARVGYIHGRMTEHQLEDILMRFMNREFDVLVTTTIIETGVDMPNVNTLLVEDADHYGLSQLYQLRGRVGRSSRIAYAYFLYKQNKVLTEVGEKRLTAIKDFTELGSGFKIAMRDLSIRGAGNMLGKKQHGFIDSVGYDLYAQMLDDAIKAKRGEKTVTTSNAEIELDIEAYIPDEYITDQRQKIEFYKKIKQAKSLAELDEIKDELVDRFGDYDTAVENLLAIAQIKFLADLAQVENIRRERSGQLKVSFTKKVSELLKGENILRALNNIDLRVKINLSEQGKIEVIMLLGQKNSRQVFAELEEFLQQVIQIIEEEK